METNLRMKNDRGNSRMGSRATTQMNNEKNKLQRNNLGLKKIRKGNQTNRKNLKSS